MFEVFLCLLEAKAAIFNFFFLVFRCFFVVRIASALVLNLDAGTGSYVQHPLTDSWCRFHGDSSECEM